MGAATSDGGTPHQVVPSGSFDACQFFGHLDQKLARLAALDLVERLHDPDRTGRLHEAEHALRSLLAGRSPPVLIAEEERDRNFKRLGNTLKPSGADTVHALFVLLHLLEGYPDPIRKLGLGQTALQSPRTHAPSDFCVTTVSPSRAYVLVDNLGLFHDIFVFTSFELHLPRCNRAPHFVLLPPRYSKQP